MLLSTLALLAVAPTMPSLSAHSVGPIIVTYHVDRGSYCVRSGWTSASFATSRRIRAGECRTANDWRRRGISVDEAAVSQALHTPASNQIAAR